MPQLVQIDTRQAARQFNNLARQLSDSQIKKATVRGINYGIMRARTDYKAAIRNKYNLQASDITPMILLGRASYATPEGKISGKNKPISLSHFAPKFESVGGTITIKSVSVYKRKNKFSNEWKKGRTLAQRKTGKGKSADQRAKGVSIEVEKGARKQISFAFLNSSMRNNGANGVATQIWAKSMNKYSQGRFEPRFHRLNKSGKDDPIVPLKTVSPFNVLVKESVREPVVSNAMSNYQQEFVRQLNLLIS